MSEIERRLTEKELAEFVTDLLRAQGLEVLPDFPISKRFRIDLLVRRNPTLAVRDRLVEIKDIPPQTHIRLGTAVEQLHLYREQYLKHIGRQADLALVTPGILSTKNLDFLDRQGIAGYDKHWLLESAYRAGLHDRAVELLGTEEPRSIKSELLSRLESVPPGHSHWRPYQQVCLDILNHLFSPPLKRGIWESSNEAKINRRDIVMPNYSIDGFWYHLRQVYRADHIVVDAKNFTGNVSKNQVLQMANYLSRHGTGLFGMIITRSGGDKSSVYVRREQWMMHDKLILVLNDDDLGQMLTAKRNGELAELLIQQKIEDFRLRI